MNTETVQPNVDASAETAAESTEELKVAVEGLHGVKAGDFEAGDSIVEDLVEGVRPEASQDTQMVTAESAIEQQSL